MTETPSPAPVARFAVLKQPALIVALLAIALSLLIWAISASHFDSLRNDLAKRLSEGDTVARASRDDSRQARDDVQALSARVTLLEAKLSDAQGQQAALEAMYQDLARGRDERLLAEIEQSVAIAAQQLQLAGNVEAALIALQNADSRLAKNGNAQFAGIRRLLTRDIERLKALPQADVSGIALRLEGIVAVVDNLPLAFTQRPPSATSKSLPKAPTPAITDAAYISGLLDGAWGEVKQMIRIERMDKDAPALLAPSQALFLRENLRLRLLNARLSLLQRDSNSFHDDVRLAAKWLQQYFDIRSPEVKNANDALQRMAASQLDLSLPALDETLAAIRNVRLPREKK